MLTETSWMIEEITRSNLYEIAYEESKNIELIETKRRNDGCWCLRGGGNWGINFKV